MLLNSPGRRIPQRYLSGGESAAGNDPMAWISPHDHRPPNIPSRKPHPTPERRRPCSRATYKAPFVATLNFNFFCFLYPLPTHTRNHDQAHIPGGPGDRPPRPQHRAPPPPLRRAINQAVPHRRPQAQHQRRPLFHARPLDAAGQPRPERPVPICRLWRRHRQPYCQHRSRHCCLHWSQRQQRDRQPNPSRYISP